MTKAMVGMTVAAVALIGVATVIVWRQLAIEDVIVAKWQQREDAHDLAAELRHSSDDLTRMARTYAVTGDERFRLHFQEILDIRKGAAPRPIDYHLVYWDLVTAAEERPRGTGEAVALRALMQDAGFTAAELTMLEAAEDESNLLTEMENDAFAAVAAGDLDDAQQLLHSPAYHQAKADIMLPIQRFVQAMEQRTSAEIAALLARQDRLNRVFLATVAALVVLVAVALAMGLSAVRRSANSEGA